MDRFFVKQENLQGEKVVLVGQQAHQINNVLRKKAGEHIIVLDNLGAEYEIELQTIKKEKVTGQIKENRKAVGEPVAEITLYQSLLSRENFEWVLQKCTEVGVTSFVPIVTERSIVRRQDAITPRKLSRWRDIITEAAEQSGRGRIPQLEQAVNFVDAVSGLGDFDHCLIGTLGVTGSNVREVLRTFSAEPITVALFIGPEGGFTDKEVTVACSKGATAFSLGKRILRTETAAVVASAVILYELGELAP